METKITSNLAITRYRGKKVNEIQKSASKLDVSFSVSIVSRGVNPNFSTNYGVSNPRS